MGANAVIDINSILSDQKVQQFLADAPDEILQNFQFSVPWQYDYDDDGFAQPASVLSSISGNKSDVPAATRKVLQQQCWQKALENPIVNTAVRGSMGRATGDGFFVFSSIRDISQVISDTELDPRNQLWLNYPKFFVRSKIEGELFLMFTCHEDGFIEIDFIDPAVVCGGNDDSGIISHPNKASLPLVYMLDDNNGEKQQIPGIFLARYPDLINVAAKNEHYDSYLLLKHKKTSSSMFDKMNGYYRFVVSWDQGWFTKRNTGHVRTVLKWTELYENLKYWEAEYKKAMSAYVWVYQIEDAKAFKLWLTLSEENKRKTGILAKKTPGSTMVVPPGFKLTCVNPQLPKLSDEDRDILGLQSAGLGEPQDVSTSEARGTFASVTASRGPFADRTSDENCYWERFLKYSFWGSVFFLKSAISEFPETFKKKECVGWKEDEEKTPIFDLVPRKPEECLGVSFPTSEIVNDESKVKALLGVKHGSTNAVLGIPNEAISEAIGFKNYHNMRLRKATEDEMYPLLLNPLDQESDQETREAEPKLPKNQGKKEPEDVSRETKKKGD